MKQKIFGRSLKLCLDPIQDIQDSILTTQTKVLNTRKSLTDTPDTNNLQYSPHIYTFSISIYCI